jgi:hypothetical protein
VLAVAAMASWFWQPGTRAVSPSRETVRTVAGSLAEDSAARQPAGSERVRGPSGQAYHARAIETIRTGQRVLARNPQSAEAELPDAPVDLASWVNIHLRMAQATGDGVQLGHLPQASADLGVELDEPEQFVRPMEAEDQPAAGVRFEGVGELGDLAGGLVGEGERQAIVRQGPRQAVEILARLRFDPGQGVPLRLRLDDADGPGVDVEHVVGLAGG